MKSILMVQISSSRDGSTFSGLLLLNGLRKAGWETHVLFAHDGPMRSEYERAGHTVRVVEHNNWLRRAGIFHFLRDTLTEYRNASVLREVIEDIDPDVIYVNTSVSLAALIAARRSGIPAVWHLRELFSDVGGEMESPIILRSLIRRSFTALADAVIAPSAAIADNMTGKDASSVNIVPNAVDLSQFDIDLPMNEARQRLGLPVTGPIIGVPGMLRPMKGHTFFLEAVVHLIESNPDLIAAVTGAGSEAFERDLRAFVDRLGIAANIRFLGVLEDMPSFYRSCDVICVPSRAEPFGRTVIEAMAAGVPVVATDVGGIPEIIDHTRSGWLVPYGDVAALSGRIGTVLDDRVHADRIAAEAARRARRDYDSVQYVDRIRQLIESTLKTVANA